MLYQGNTVIAVLLMLPLIAIALAFLNPGAGPGHYALTEEFGPIRKPEDTPKQYQLRLAKWWAIGSSALPIGHAFGVVFNASNEIFFLITLIGYIFGIACLIKLIGCLLNAVRL